MPAWLSPVAVVVAGAIGGTANAGMTQNGFIMPAMTAGDDVRVWRPGVLGNVAIGAVAALVSWGLYGSGAALQVFTSATTTSDLTYSALVGAILVGMGGARWLTAEVDKNLLRGAAIAAAKKDPSPDLAGQIAISSPVEALAAATKR